jgi:hypothetical protein
MITRRGYDLGSSRREEAHTMPRNRNQSLLTSAATTKRFVAGATLLFALLGPLATQAATNVTVIDARNVLVRHFDGWGTSLCWWAHIVGGFTNRDEYADLAFKELGWNIVRYNIGGGENPAHSNTMELRARIPGFQPEPGTWDWNADANQRWMLRAAVARGANHVVAFANSPPRALEISGSSGIRRRTPSQGRLRRLGPRPVFPRPAVHHARTLLGR